MDSLNMGRVEYKWRWASIMVAGLAIAIAIAGCAGKPKKIKITGQLTRNSQPLKVSEQTYVTLIFVPQGESVAQSYPANFKHATGTYELELPPGKYRANVFVMDAAQQGLPPKPPSPDSTPLVYDLTENKEIHIEVPK